MSKRRRNRRPNGHPAKVAGRRERDMARRSGHGGELGKLARRIVREADELTAALDAELWVAALLGAMWERRYGLPLVEAASEDMILVYGEPVLAEVANLGGTGAAIALNVIGQVDDGELGLRAAVLARGLSREIELPNWIADVGNAEITAAAVLREDVFDDAVTVFIEARHRDGEVHAVGVRIDNNLGRMAKDIMLADGIERVAEAIRDHPPEDGEVRLESIAPATAGAWIREALALTDVTVDPPLSDEYAGLRAMALLRADEVPGNGNPPARPELSSAERDQLREEFLASPEGREFPPDGDEAFAVSLAIDFCADYVDGRPLRWSPVLVEMFMAAWIPHKVLADEDLFDQLPSALDAWVRFAGRKLGTPGWAINQTRAAIPQWSREMTERGHDPDTGGPSKQFLTAAHEAGIDLADRDALDAFVAGWNARSLAP
jgi:hypothetical protein